MITLKGPKSLIGHQPHIWLCVILMKYNFIFGVCDRRQRQKTLYYLLQNILSFLSVTYLLFGLMCFYSES